jgi:hypothetical protein
MARPIARPDPDRADMDARALFIGTLKMTVTENSPRGRPPARQQEPAGRFTPSAGRGYHHEATRRSRSRNAARNPTSPQRR